MSMIRFGDFYQHPDYPERTMVRFGGEALFEQYLREPAIAALSWPEAVVEDWLWEHGNHEPFLDEYGHIDLEAVVWMREELPAADFLTIPTDPDGTEYLDVDTPNPWRFTIMPRGVQEVWLRQGTWPREPLLIERRLVDGGECLQLVEGRGRVGMLRARHADGHMLAEQPAAWVGRRRP